MYKIKKAIIWVIFVIFSGSAIINIVNQFSILASAKEKNKTLEDEIKKLIEINRDLKKKTEYATSSAFLKEAAREKFGLGTENDYWIITTPEDKSLNLFTQ